MVNEGWALSSNVRNKIGTAGVATNTGTSIINQEVLKDNIIVDRHEYVAANSDYDTASTQPVEENSLLPGKPFDNPHNVNAEESKEVDVTGYIPTEVFVDNTNYEATTGWGNTHGGTATIWNTESGKPDNALDFGKDVSTKKVYRTPGGAKTTLNLNIESNKHVGNMIDIMEIQKKNMPGNVGKFGGFNQITGEALLPKHTPGTQKFEIKNYLPNEKATSRDAWYNIGKNVDPKQHQSALDRQSLNKFENYLQSQWSMGVRGGVAQHSDIFGQIKNSNISAAEKKRLQKEYEKKTKNYQNAIGGTKEKPWEWGRYQPDVSTGPGLLSGKVDKKGKPFDWKSLSDPNFSFE